jgi:hypothetical protein
MKVRIQYVYVRLHRCKTEVSVKPTTQNEATSLGWSFSRNTFDKSHTFVESVTSLYHFSL